MDVFLHTLFHQDSLDQLVEGIADDASGQAEDDLADQARVVFPAGGRRELSFSVGASFCAFVPGVNKIRGTQAKVRGERDLILLHRTSLVDMKYLTSKRCKKSR